MDHQQVNWDQVAIEANYKDSRNANEHGWFLETGRDGNVIQGSVSLDSETVQDGCTEINPGYSQYLREWWEAVVTRNPNDRSLKASGFTKDMA